jgi:hypothetical protein
MLKRATISSVDNDNGPPRCMERATIRISKKSGYVYLFFGVFSAGETCSTTGSHIGCIFPVLFVSI